MKPHVFGEWLRRASRLFARVPSFVYALIYLSIIPLFACIFAAMPGAFYCPNVHLEPAAKSKLVSLAETFEREIEHPTVSVAPSWVLRRQQPTDSVVLSSIGVRFLESTGDSIVGSIIVNVQDSIGPGGYWYGNIIIRVFPQSDEDSRRGRYTDPDAKTLLISLHWNRFPNPTFSDKEQGILEYSVFKNVYGGRGLILMRVPPSIYSRFREYMDAINGLPTGFLETLPRMLYLSMVTITTLGYGDLVPIRESSRFLVGAESLFGVVLIGLFLNSLSKEST